MLLMRTSVCKALSVRLLFREIYANIQVYTVEETKAPQLF